LVINKRKIIVRIEYLSDLYDEQTIQRYASYYKNILKVVLNNPNIKIRDIEILDSNEKEYQLYELNNTGMLV